MRLNNWRVLIADNILDVGLSSLKEVATVIDRRGVSASNLLHEVTDVHGIIVRGRTKITEQVIDSAGHLKVIGRAGIGVDNIDLKAAQKRHITVVNTPEVATVAVAEHTLGLMLALVRHISQGDRTMKDGKWIKKDIIGVELRDKTLGIIGIGRIGAAVTARAHAFGMRIIAHDPFISPEIFTDLESQSVDLNELFRHADFISIHVPLTTHSLNLIDKSAFARMKRGVYLICTARGGIVAEDALLEALTSGHVAGAALDVFANEPPGESELITHPHVLATPHISAQTIEAQSKASEEIAQEVLAALRGEPLRWKIV